MMKKTTALSAFEVLTASPIIPVIAIKQLKDAVPLASALVNAGVRVLEITLRTEYGLEAIRMVKEQVPNAIVGAGTVVNATQYTQAVESGAEPRTDGIFATKKHRICRTFYSGYRYTIGINAS